jgi:hypothetical protein
VRALSSLRAAHGIVNMLLGRSLECDEGRQWQQRTLLGRQEAPARPMLPAAARSEEAGAGSIKMRANVRLRLDQRAYSTVQRNPSRIDEAWTAVSHCGTKEGLLRAACGTARSEAFFVRSSSMCPGSARATAREREFVKGTSLGKGAEKHVYVWADWYSHPPSCAWR